MIHSDHDWLKKVCVMTPWQIAKLMMMIIMKNIFFNKNKPDYGFRMDFVPNELLKN